MNNIIEVVANFALSKHEGQEYFVDGKSCPYFYHLENVRKIINKYVDEDNPKKEKLEIIALLHDIIEDTDVTYNQLKEMVGEDIAKAVMALTKNESLPYVDRLKDSLKRICEEDIDVGQVKLADRICNLMEFPKTWDNKKIRTREIVE